jgi:hypothetical protein
MDEMEAAEELIMKSSQLLSVHGYGEAYRDDITIAVHKITIVILLRYIKLLL